MADVRKRPEKKKPYQVRYLDTSMKSGYGYKSFVRSADANKFKAQKDLEEGGILPSTSIRTVHQAIDEWIVICKHEGTDNREPVTANTLNNYEYRAEYMKAYGWDKELRELTTPDIVNFRSWLLQNCVSRDQARRVLSSFHTVLKEMTLRGVIKANPAADVSIRESSRYEQPIEPPTEREIFELLAAADRLANSKNKRIADSWERYRPIMYLAADTGMRPQEYLVVPKQNMEPEIVKVDRAIEKGAWKISVTKTPAGWRWIEVSLETSEMALHYAEKNGVSGCDLLFPTSTGGFVGVDNWRNRGFRAACEEAGLMVQVEEDGKTVEKPKLKPYDLRHFFASMLIEQDTNLKRIQLLMGHRDIKTTLNNYGHLIERVESAKQKRKGMLASLGQDSCGQIVAELH